MVDVHTVGAGGGSIAWRDAGGALRVGPRSAGADPGPAGYGRGGEEPTVTDANLLLGYLDARLAARGRRRARRRRGRARGRGAGRVARPVDARRRAAGIVRVASAEMARAVRVMTVERGIDPRDLALLAFGGAGPLHAAAIADELGMTRVVVPRASRRAVGARHARVRAPPRPGRERAADAATTSPARRSPRWSSGWPSAAARSSAQPDAEVRAALRPALRRPGVRADRSTATRARPGRPARARSTRAHEERYGYADDDAELELVTVRVAVALPGADLPGGERGDHEERGTRTRVFDGDEHEAAMHRGAPDASRARRSSSCPRRRWSSRPAGAAARPTTGRW